MGKGLTVILVMLVLVVLFWIGMGIYFVTTDVKVDPNAKTYITHISPSFQTDGLDLVIERIDDNLPISPSSFSALNSDAQDGAGN